MAMTARLLLLLVMVVASLALQGTQARKLQSVSKYRLYQDMDQPVEERVKDLLKRMTLAEKIGQMTQTERTVTNHTNIREFGIGGY